MQVLFTSKKKKKKNVGSFLVIHTQLSDHFTSSVLVCYFLPDPPPPLIPCAGPAEDKVMPAPTTPPAEIAPGTKKDEVASDCSSVEATTPPPPYPSQGLYPSLKSVREGGEGPWRIVVTSRAGLISRLRGRVRHSEEVQRNPCVVITSAAQSVALATSPTGRIALSRPAVDAGAEPRGQRPRGLALRGAAPQHPPRGLRPRSLIGPRGGRTYEQPTQHGRR